MVNLNGSKPKLSSNRVSQIDNHVPIDISEMSEATTVPGDDLLGFARKSKLVVTLSCQFNRRFWLFQYVQYLSRGDVLPFNIGKMCIDYFQSIQTRLMLNLPSCMSHEFPFLKSLIYN